MLFVVAVHFFEKHLPEVHLLHYRHWLRISYLQDLPETVLRKAISVAGYEPPSLQPGASAGNHDIESAQHTQQERHKSARAADRVEEVLHQSTTGRSRDPRWTTMRSSLGRAVSVSLHTHTSFAAVTTSLILLSTSSRLMWHAAAAHARPAPESQDGSCMEGSGQLGVPLLGLHLLVS